MKSMPSLDENYDLWSLLAQTRQLMLKARQKELDKCNVSSRHIYVMQVIDKIGHNATPAEISRWLWSEPHSVSELLSRMEKLGLVRKSRDLGIKNLVRIEVTEKGRELCHQAAKTETVHNIMSSLSEEECQQLRSHLMKLRRKALEKLGVEGEAPFRPISR